MKLGIFCFGCFVGGMFMMAVNYSQFLLGWTAMAGIGVIVDSIINYIKK
ncbi:MAG: hypothetical protein AABY32_01400 [Nanoarchaeota archaeon]